MTPFGRTCRWGQIIMVARCILLAAELKKAGA